MYQRFDPKTKWDVWTLPLVGDHKPRPFLQTEFDKGQGQFSADGRWVAFTLNESGRPEVYVQAFPGPGPKLQISTMGGAQPQWRRDGKELFYLVGPNLMAVEIKSGDPFEAGVPRSLFRGDWMPGWGNLERSDFAVSADAKRFLVMKSAQDAITSAPITVVLNWQAQLNTSTRP